MNLKPIIRQKRENIVKKVMIKIATSSLAQLEFKMYIKHYSITN